MTPRMPRPASPCRSTATSTAGSRTRRSRASRSASRSLEGGLGAVATASGLGAEFITFASLAGAGDHIVVVREPLRRLGHPARRHAAPVRGRHDVHPRHPIPADYAAAITDKTKLIFAETIANPSGEIADIEGLAEVAHAHHLPLIVDSTVATPYLNRPIEWGADVVIHSATKFLGGHGTTLGGVVVESGRFHWANEQFPLFDQEVPQLRRPQLARQLRRVRVPHPAARRAAARHRPGARAALGVAARARASRRCRSGCRRTSTTPRIVAEWLDADHAHRVRELGGPARAPAPRAREEVPAEGSGLGVRFGVKGGRRRGRPDVHRERRTCASHLANIGDAKTLVIHPASTTHAQLSEQQLLDAGVLPGLVRISVGIEDPEDIIDDLDQALTAATKRMNRDMTHRDR